MERSLLVDSELRMMMYGLPALEHEKALLTQGQQGCVLQACFD